MSNNNKKFQSKRGRKASGSFLLLPHNVMNSESFIALSGKALKLLCDIAIQFRGKNNGDLQATWHFMKKRGWKSRSTLWDALQELLHYGLIEKTRQGGLNRCSLFALTWQSIDDCGGKLDVSATHVASGNWKTPKAKFEPSRKKIASTDPGTAQHDIRVSALPLAA